MVLPHFHLNLPLRPQDYQILVQLHLEGLEEPQTLLATNYKSHSQKALTVKFYLGKIAEVRQIVFLLVWLTYLCVFRERSECK